MNLRDLNEKKREHTDNMLNDKILTYWDFFVTPNRISLLWERKIETLISKNK